MKNFVVARSNQKITTMVDKKAFFDVIASLSKTISGIKVNANKSIIKISDNSKFVELIVFVKIQKNEKISSKVKEIKLKIENHCLFLLDSKPKNISIIYLGEY